MICFSLAVMTLVCTQRLEAFSLSSHLEHGSTSGSTSTALSSSVTTNLPLSSVGKTDVSALYSTAEATRRPPVHVQRSESIGGTPTESVSKAHAITILESTEALTEFMNGSGGDELTVIKYHAHYCKICQRAGIQLKKVASEFPDVRFGKVESMVFPDSANTLRSLGVSKFPFVQIYRHGECVASFSTGPSHMFVKRVRDTIGDCQRRSPEEWQHFTTEFANEIASNHEARQALSKLS